ncbi:MAG: sensor histidine kinase [Saprospiraceae bacterium]|nr:sensor histidine kinase [Saprospiraceae bacterium]
MTNDNQRRVSAWSLFALYCIVAGGLIYLGVQFHIYQMDAWIEQNKANQEKMLSSYGIMLLEGVFSIYLFFSGTAFLVIWRKMDVLFLTNPELRQFRDKRGGNLFDISHLFFAWAVWIWMLVYLIDRPLIHRPHVDLITTLLSTINSGLFLAATVDFDYEGDPPWWVRQPLLNKWFQQFNGIIYSTLVTLGLTVALYLFFLTFPDEKMAFKFYYVPDLIFTLPTTVVLFGGLIYLFKKRDMWRLIPLVVFSLLFLVVAQMLYLFENWEFPLIKHPIPAYLDVGYKATLILLVLLLTITYQGHLQKQLLAHQTESERLIHREMAHRVKNHFNIIANGIRDQIRKHSEPANQPVLMALMTTQVRVSAIHTLHILLDHNSTILDGRDEAPALQYFEQVMKALSESFFYPEGQFVYSIAPYIDKSIKVGIAKDIGRVITELALNVNEHAYADHEDKYIEVRLGETEDCFRIEVLDRGKGFNPSKIDTTGQGFAIIEQIVSQFDGTSDVITNDEVRGTHFTIQFKWRSLQ